MCSDKDLSVCFCWVTHGSLLEHSVSMVLASLGYVAVTDLEKHSQHKTIDLEEATPKVRTVVAY